MPPAHHGGVNKGALFLYLELKRSKTTYALIIRIFAVNNTEKVCVDFLASAQLDETHRLQQVITIRSSDGFEGINDCVFMTGCR